MTRPGKNVKICHMSYVIWKFRNRFSRTIINCISFLLLRFRKVWFSGVRLYFFVIESFWSFPGALLIKEWLSEFARPAGSFHLKSVGRNYPLILPLNQTNSYGEISLSRNFKLLGHLNSQAIGLDSWVQSALKSILRGTLFLNWLPDFSLLSSNSFLHPFLKLKFTKKKILDTKKISFSKAENFKFF